MADDPIGSGRFSLRRWSQRKLDAARDGSRSPNPHAPGAQVAPGMENAPSTPGGDARAAPDAPPAAARETPAPHSPAYDPAGASPAPEAALPPVESLTFDSDFTPFMRPGVDADVRRSAVRKLLRDPRFNVMDGLDVYIDDYSIPSPIEPELVRTLMQARYLFNPPQTRVNAQGFVEDVPQDEVHDAAGAAQPLSDAGETADAPAPPIQSADPLAQPLDAPTAIEGNPHVVQTGDAAVADRQPATKSG